MHRWTRRLLSFLVAFVLAFGNVAGASAKTPEIGEAPTLNRREALPNAPGREPVEHGPALVVPHDVPVVLPTAREAIPPVPPSYITKDLGWLEFSYPPQASERVASILQEA